MNSKIIKFVAGGGKTTYSENHLETYENGLYLAFTNSVIDDISRKGYLSKTIDSLFTSFLIPKFCCVIPIINNSSKVTFIDNNQLPTHLKNVSQIKLDENGKIYNKSKKICVDIHEKNEVLHQRTDFPNSKAIKYIFGKEKLRLTHELRSGLCDYIIKKYGNELIEILSSRFNYIIIDEAQDLKGYRKRFAELLYNSKIPLILLGDDNQNINGGDQWFESLKADYTKNISHRCPETNCRWIRENLKIDIHGNSNVCTFNIIKYDEAETYDNGIRFLLYTSKSGKNKEIIDKWNGPKATIKSAKGSTIKVDIVIIGDKINDKNLYTAITRTTKNVYSTVKK